MRLMDKQFTLAKSCDDGIVLISDATGKGKSTEAAEFIKYKVSQGVKVFVVGPDKACCKNMIKRLRGTSISYAMFESKEDNAKKAPEINYDIIKNEALKNLIKEFYEEKRKLDCFYKMPEHNKDFLKETITVQSEKLVKVKNKIRATFIKMTKDPKNFADVEKGKTILKPLFPENLDSYNVIFMTTDKFFRKRIDTLDNDNRILENKNLKGKYCVIMDETDACYEKHCRIKAERSLQLDDALSIIQLYYNQNCTEENRKFRKKFDQKFEEEFGKHVKELITEIKDANSEFHLLENIFVSDEVNNSFKMFSNSKRSFVLNKGDTGYIFVEENGTYILKKSNDNSVQKLNLVNMMTTITRIVFGIFNQFFMQKNKVENFHPNWMEEELFSHAISQVLNIIEPDLKSRVIESAIDRQSDFNAVGSDNQIKSVCTHGFRMLNFTNGDGYNHTHAEITDFSSTPENDILACAKKGLVVMMSATQQIKTPYNYDMQYFKESLGENFHSVSKEDFDENNRLYIKEYENNENIIAKEISFDTVRDVLKNLKECGFNLSDTKIEELLNKHCEEIKRKNQKSGEYYTKKYLRKVFSLIYFLLEGEAKKGIIMNNSLGKEYEEFFSQIQKELTKVIEGTKQNKTVIKCISAEHLKSNDTINEIHKAAKEGNKVLIVSSKNTIGQSVNLQENDIDQNSTDFNFIYIEEPTYINYNNFEGITKCEQIKEYYERLKLAEMENKSEKTLLSEKTLKTYFLHRNKRGALCLQSMGRVWRTNNKENKTFVFFDADLSPSLRFLCDEEFEYTPLYIATLKTIEQNDAKKPVSEEAVKNNEFSNEYKRLLKKAQIVCQDSSNPAREKIEEIRNYLFTHGVYVSVDACENSEIFNMCYVKATRSDCYYIDKTDNYCEDISCFLPSGNRNYTKLNYKDFSLKNGYKIPNEKECYVLLPKAFNILQGEVGEKGFEKWFDEFSYNYYVSPLVDSEFEKCGDFKIHNKKDNSPTDVYIDVKNFSFYSEKDVTDLVDRKLSNIRSHNENGKIIILNFWADKDYKKVKSDNALIISDFIINGVINTKAFKEIENFIKQ